MKLDHKSRSALRILSGAFALSFFILLYPAAPAFAKMQDKATCQALKSEHAEFKKSGILDDMDKGPEWVKDNLEPAQIERIKRYLTLDATLIFQCPGTKGPEIKRQKKAVQAKKAGAKKSTPKKKIIRKKTYKKKKKAS